MTEHMEDPQRVAPGPRDTINPGRASRIPDLSGELIAHRLLDVVDGQPPVPIDVWRVADDQPGYLPLSDAPKDVTTTQWRCTTRTAQLLVGLFATTGSVVISIGFDPVLAGVAGAVGCPYQPVDRITDLARLPHLAERVGLLLIPWPATGTNRDRSQPPTTPDGNDAARVADWLGACRTLMTNRGVTVVVLAPAPPTDAYVACARLLLPAARSAGLGWLQHIVAITAPVTDLDPAEVKADGATRPAASDRTPGRDDLASASVHADLLALVLRGGRHG